ncbi:MAG: AraC family transcriptional regulator [Gammaproteobacteria bacterium]|nr:AraC family transcriptional regulator [Gammaproteobacteria bacterium]MDH4314663.1 AraC family transcriptional regulator [Gammaproteobacteria bacterium]MDH5213390.1 AraC family transcriptional regulator [Gammaproteobacteria bacterium]MDH5502319.1 AraC family transcriptional regulator [Gammaproteobacteria bacterium]
MTGKRNRMVTNAAAIGIVWLAGIVAAFAQGSAIQNPDVVAANAASTEVDQAQSRSQFRSLDEDVQSLKKEVLDLNRDLFLLEEELLFPANSQVAFFISMDVGEYFELDSVTLKIDGKDVANYLYTEREAKALLRGGVHRVHMGNLKVGDHELIAVFTGKGPHVRDYRRGATMTFNKGIGAKYVEMEITDRVAKQQPEFVIKEWE